MRFYLLRLDNTWSDLGYYESKPEDREDGVWVEGEPDGLNHFARPDISVNLFATFDTLPEDVQVQFAGIRLIVKNELSEGRFNIAKKLIENQRVPAELESFKQLLLDQF